MLWISTSLLKMKIQPPTALCRRSNTNVPKFNRYTLIMTYQKGINTFTRVSSYQQGNNNKEDFNVKQQQQQSNSEIFKNFTDSLMFSEGEVHMVVQTQNKETLACFLSH